MFLQYLLHLGGVQGLGQEAGHGQSLQPLQVVGGTEVVSITTTITWRWASGSCW